MGRAIITLSLCWIVFGIYSVDHLTINKRDSLVDKPTDPMIGRTIGKYHILSVLGGGGMGTVYRARQSDSTLHTAREVAVKVINIDLADSEQFMMRFKREAEAIATLEHPHIITIFDYGQEGELTYIVMALKLGGNLGNIIKGERPGLHETGRLITQIASALDYAHSRGIIHRDLKPANILLDNEKNCFLTDFGIARRLGESRLTAQGMIVGSPIYMAPEAWRGEEPSAETDVYSLAVILWELLVGQPVFTDKAPARLMMKHINEPIVSVRTMRPDLPAPIDAFFARALAKERNERYHSAGELVTMFGKAVGITFKGGTVRVSRPSAGPVPPSPDLTAPMPSSGQMLGQAPAQIPMSQNPAVQQPYTAPPRSDPIPTPGMPTAKRPAMPMEPVPQAAASAPTGGLNRTTLMVMGGIIILLLIVIVILLVSR